MSGIIITGTDTGVGKTVVTGLLAGYLQAQGLQVVTMKPVQTGCTDIVEDLTEHDRWAGAPLAAAVDAPFRCPYCFPLAASPHLAAAQAGVRIDMMQIVSAYHALAARYDVVLVEGAGGAMVPLTDTLLTVDLLAALALPTLVVAANRLGCINHTLLTVAALQHRNIPLFGIVMNRQHGIGDPAIVADNPRIIAHFATTSVLGELPPIHQPADARQAFAPLGAQILTLLGKP